MSALVLLLVFAFAPAAAAYGDPASSSQASLNQYESQALQIAQQIAQEQQQADYWGEQLDRAMVQAQILQQQIQADTSKLLSAQAQLEQEKAQLRNAVLAEYLSLGSDSALSKLLLTPLTTTQTYETYARLANERLQEGIKEVETTTNSIKTLLLEKQRDLQQVNLEIAQASQARARAIAAVDSEQQSLSQVKGEIAQALKQLAQSAEQATVSQASQSSSGPAPQSPQNRPPTTTTTIAASQGASSQASVAQAAELALQAAGQAPVESTPPAKAAVATVPSSLAGSKALPLATAEQGLEAVRAAESFIGTPYVWGGSTPGPNGGLDCSGLTMEAWAAAGIYLLHSAYYQYLESTPIPISELRPGDLIFYNFSGTGDPSGIDHVVMYMGSGPYGPATIIQAAHTGTVVSFAPMYYVGLIGAGRP